LTDAVWPIGRIIRCVSSSLNLKPLQIDEMLDNMFLCEKTTLFGFPVVPEE
jgi:hypothetical protein